MYLVGSPASNGGRGLKLVKGFELVFERLGFARQQWRAWIETSAPGKGWRGG